MRIFGVDPGSERTGYGCIESLGQPSPPRHLRHPLGPRPLDLPGTSCTHPRRPGRAARNATGRNASPSRTSSSPSNVRSALKLGHARGVALLAASEAGIPVVEYTPAEIKRAVVGYGRAEKQQVQQMMKLLLGLDARAVAARRRRRARRRDLPHAHQHRHRQPSVAGAGDAARRRAARGAVPA